MRRRITSLRGFLIGLNIWMIIQTHGLLFGGACSAITPELTFRTLVDTYFGAPRDYCFMATAGQGYEFSTCAPEGGATFNTLLEIRNDDSGTLLASENNTPGCNGQARMAWIAPSDGNYRLRIRGFGGSGQFSMAYRMVQPPPCADQIEPNEGIQVASDSIAPFESKDFCFNAVGGLSYEFYTCPPDGYANFDTIIEVRDALGRTILAANDDFCGLQSYVSWRAVSTGPVRARVLGFGDASGDFDLAYRQMGIPPCTPVEPMGDFQFDEGMINPGQFVDYCFDSSPGAQYEFMTCGPGFADFNTTLEVRTAFGDFITSNTNFCGLQSRVVYSPTNPARYRVRMRGANVQDRGNYRMSYRIVLPPPCIEITPETRLQLTDGTLTAGSFKDYCVDATEGQVFEFRTCPPGSSSVATSVDLLDAGATTTLPVDQRITCSPSLGQQVLYKASRTGRLRVRVRNQTQSSGIYTMTHQIYTPPACTTISPERTDATISNTLEPASFKDYCFQGEAGQGYEFSTCPPRGGAAFPSVMEIRDDSGIRLMSVVARTPCSQGDEVLFRPTSRGTYRVRIISGSTGGSYSLAYRTSPWVARAPIPVTNGLGITTSVVSGGRIYVIGGVLGSFASYVNQVWAFDPSAGTWLRRADIPIPAGIVAYGSAAAVGGSIYVFGGATFGGSFLNTLWIYNTATDTWSRGADIPGGPRIGAVVAAVDGKIILAGGYNGGTDLNATLEYDPVANTYTTKANMPSPTLGVGTLVTVAGRPELHALSSYGRFPVHHVYDVTANTWRTGAALPPFSAYGPAVVSVAGKIYVAGGTPAGRTQIYDPVNNTWSQGPLMPGAVENTSGVSIGNVITVMGSFDRNINTAFPFNYNLTIE